MKQIILLFALVVCCDFVFAQDLTFNTRPILGTKVFNYPIVFPRANTDTHVIICHKPVFRYSDKPLYVVDGILENEAAVKKLDPENIESISLLNTKDFAKIISCWSPKAVIVIVTKTAHQRTIIIKDMFNGEVLPGASVEIISAERTKNTLHLIADSFGRVVTNKIAPGKEYKIRVSSIGYKSYNANLNAAMIGKNYSVALSPSNVSKELKIFPNPVLRSQNITIEFESKSVTKVTIVVFSLDSKLVAESEYDVNQGINRINYLIDAKLAAGVYSVHVIDITERFIRSGKLIVQ